MKKLAWLLPVILLAGCSGTPFVLNDAAGAGSVDFNINGQRVVMQSEVHFIPVDDETAVCPVAVVYLPPSPLALKGTTPNAHAACVARFGVLGLKVEQTPSF